MTTVKLDILNANAWQRAKAEEARSLLQSTVNSQRFQAAVLKSSFLDVRLMKPDGSTLSGLSNQQILNLIVYGTESGTFADGVIGLNIALYNKLFSSAIGWTDDENGVIHTHQKFFNGAEPIEIAGHWLHEWTHLAGFRHDYARTARRDRSVPYLIGELLIQSATDAG